MIKEIIISEITKAVKDLFNTTADFTVSPALKFGDYASNIAMIVKNDHPSETAEQLKNKLLESKTFTETVSRVEIAGPGFLNFTINDIVLWEEIKKCETAPENKNPKTILVEYGQENIAKQMSVGHLRSNIIGQSLVNIFKFLGDKVISDNHLGDWGTQFGKLIVAFKKWGDKEKVLKDPIAELNALYVMFHQEAEMDPLLEDEARLEFKKLEDGDLENEKLWQWFRDESIKEFGKIHKRLGVSFDFMHGEAFYKEELSGIISELLEKKIATKNDDGSIMVTFPEEFSSSPLLIQKSDGATLYATRDLAAIKFYKKEFNPDMVLQCAGSEQALHFKQIYNTAQRAGWIKEGQFIHIQNGMIRLPEGKMSTRKGNVVKLEDLFNESEERTKKILEERKSEIEENEKDELIKTIATGSIIFSDLGQNREDNITFTWDKALSFDGYASPYLQYTYARARSILRKEQSKDFEFKNFSGEEERKLAFKLSLFKDEVIKSTETFHLHIIARYIFDLAQTFNNFYNTTPVINSQPEEKDLRLLLVEKTSAVIKTGLSLLNIKSPEKM
ncbi:MAG: arginine--tRNA ligase [Parcubacteria group bacterium]|nr:arginine--tRNA ligase [Parcubacteria group bacterium]MCR4342856.1 arginine--tRNA ligase [Patescibacteria group bacterium]